MDLQVVSDGDIAGCGGIAGRVRIVAGVGFKGARCVRDSIHQADRGDRQGQVLHCCRSLGHAVAFHVQAAADFQVIALDPRDARGVRSGRGGIGVD